MERTISALPLGLQVLGLWVPAGVMQELDVSRFAQLQAVCMLRGTSVSTICMPPGCRLHSHEADMAALCSYQHGYLVPLVRGPGAGTYPTQHTASHAS